MSTKEIQAELERLRAENAKLHQTLENKHKLSCKVSEKGALSVYGNGRFPMTLYKEQWLRLLNFSGTIKEFIAANDGNLAVKA